MRSEPLVGGRKVAAVAIVVAFFLLTACAARQTVVTQEDLRQTYLHAVSDAAIAEPDEISRNLTAISAANTKLIWKNVPGKSSVRVVTWTAYAGYDDQIGQAVKMPIYSWVTVAPELENFCRASKLEAQALALRLEQLLGLPPNSGKNRFVELWVDPKDLFRPSPDPEISDHEAELDYPVSGRFIKVSDAHVMWFEDQKKASYGSDGYPWTRLGYTYDWGNSQSEVGLSEFVIQKGATALIKSVSTFDEYCR